MKILSKLAALTLVSIVCAQTAQAYNPPGRAGGPGHGKYWHCNPAGAAGGPGRGWVYNPPGRGNKVTFDNNYRPTNAPGLAGGVGHGRYWHYNPAGSAGGPGRGWVYNPPGPGRYYF